LSQSGSPPSPNCSFRGICHNGASITDDNALIDPVFAQRNGNNQATREDEECNRFPIVLGPSTEKKASATTVALFFICLRPASNSDEGFADLLRGLGGTSRSTVPA